MPVRINSRAMKGAKSPSGDCNTNSGKLRCKSEYGRAKLLLSRFFKREGEVRRGGCLKEPLRHGGHGAILQSPKLDSGDCSKEAEADGNHD